MLYKELLEQYNIILASAGPRRKQLLKSMGIKFSVVKLDFKEVYPPNIPISHISAYLSKQKANSFKAHTLTDKDIIITADTIVVVDGRIIPKPKNITEAKKFLKQLSGKMHLVYTGITLKSKFKEKTFSVSTKVYFKKFTNEEINYYVKTFLPLDKAGAYGIQEWLGYIGVTHIEGCFFNVMGLPTSKLYTEIIEFIKK